MTTYTAPLKDMAFVLHDVLNVSTRDIPGYADLDRSFTAAVLEEAGKLASDVLAPLNAVGDHEGCVLENGAVRTPSGFKSAFDQLRTGGWTALDCDPEFGGQGLPYLMGTAVGEIMVSANMAFKAGSQTFLHQVEVIFIAAALPARPPHPDWSEPDVTRQTDVTLHLR